MKAKEFKVGDIVIIKLESLHLLYLPDECKVGIILYIHQGIFSGKTYTVSHPFYPPYANTRVAYIRSDIRHPKPFELSDLDRLVLELTC